ncbi:AraC family transcriptional regulator [Salinisphaera hydrothermalis]|uniref:AraC family transcriptional regulator n=1 Tax=Salinisphaera hydrothermalis TaxID=563188 RepID=UPI003341C75F
MDPLSDVLRLLKPVTYVAGGFDLGGDWSIAFQAHSGIKCYALVSGTCWLAVEGVDHAVQLQAGDCILLPNGRPFRLARRLDLDPVPFLDLRWDGWNNGVATINGGHETLILGGHFVFAGAHTEILLGAMPPVIHLHEQHDKTELRWALERMRRELLDERPGNALIAQHLAHLMLVHALRLYLAHGINQNAGWLFALSDPQMAKAIGAIHADPGTRWTLPRLASKAGMSRSSFARRFKTMVGSSPIDYLTRWRMLLASDRLSADAEPISAIAMSLGYASESAFSTAFKRVMGCSPRDYARDTQQKDRGLHPLA